MGEKNENNAILNSVAVKVEVEVELGKSKKVSVLINLVNQASNWRLLWPEGLSLTLTCHNPKIIQLGGIYGSYHLKLEWV